MLTGFKDRSVVHERPSFCALPYAEEFRVTLSCPPVALTTNLVSEAGQFQDVAFPRSLFEGTLNSESHWSLHASWVSGTEHILFLNGNAHI